MKTASSSALPRYHLIDAIRAVAILNMIAYHLCYDIFCVYGMDPFFWHRTGAVIWERFICCMFIIVSGISMNFSHHGYRRGILVNLCGFLITLVSVLVLPSQAIWFGVLNLLGCAMLITFALRKVFSRLDPFVGASVSFLLFMLSYRVPKGGIGLFSYPLFSLPRALYDVRFLAFLGFPSADFSSADFFPLLPWLFLFFFGFFLWRCIERSGLAATFYFRVPVLDFIGRHSLLIYLVHQPVLYAVCFLIFGYL